jgi:NAD(P)H-dependent flavin oxidoreductase YrpB (nitropropane dioxygenase family)
MGPPRLEKRMTLRTRLTDMLAIEHPIISAPMAFAAGGKLAAVAACTGRSAGFSPWRIRST